MRFRKKLRRCLSKVTNLVLDRLPRHGVRDFVEIHRSLVRQVIEDVGRSGRFRPFLFVPGEKKSLDSIE